MFNILRNYLKFCFYVICCCVYINILLCIITMFMKYNLFHYNLFIKFVSILTTNDGYIFFNSNVYIPLIIFFYLRSDLFYNFIAYV